ncbi:hypothetical protein KHU1_2196 [Bacillus amyloliquefaciens KHG19]|nr:hypothetical protein KHU1_2196 [Bacillus amyloliquefaciens KHG19]
MAVLTGVFTKKAIIRIAHAAFQSAMERRKKVTWLGTLFEYVPRSGGQYPEVDDYHIDAMTVYLVRRQLGACTVN